MRDALRLASFVSFTGTDERAGTGRIVRANVTIDRTLRESVRAQIGGLGTTVVSCCSHPPDKQEKATERVLEQTV